MKIWHAWEKFLFVVIFWLECCKMSTFLTFSGMFFLKFDIVIMLVSYFCDTHASFDHHLGPSAAFLV